MEQIEAHHTTQFSTNWVHRTQQNKSRLDAFVEYDSFMGERKRYDRLGAMASKKVVERNAPTPITNPDSDQRWAYRESFDLGNLLGKDDEKNLGQLVLPTSDFVKLHTNAYNRDCDDVVWKAAIAPAKVGALGTDTEAFPTDQIIAHGSTGLTLTKLIDANEIFDDADLEDNAPRCLLVTARQLKNLLNTTEVKNADYNSVKALVSGQVDTFMGFKFIKVKRLPVAANIRTCVAFAKGSVRAFKGAMRSDISRRKDLSNAVQIYSDWHLGAVRVHDESVVQILCSEA